MNELLPSLAIVLISFVITLGFTVLVRRRLIARAVLDMPNERSSHTTPVPRGGGWAFLLMLAPALLLTILWQHETHLYIWLLVGMLLLACISWLDDKRNISAKIRLAAHLLAALLGTLSLPAQAQLFSFLPFWLDRAIMVFGWAWFINLYNFMDGIDGLTAMETISIATGACLVLSAASMGDPFLDILTLLLTGGSLGFLALNWRPAKIFMGDVGSVPLGYLVGFVLLSLAGRGLLSAALILPLYYLADSGITIIKRALRGEKIWQAHRQHFYQRAALAVGRHDYVVLWIIGANAVLIGSAMLAVTHPWAGLGCGIGVVAILLYKMHKTANTKIEAKG